MLPLVIVSKVVSLVVVKPFWIDESDSTLVNSASVVGDAEID